MAKINWTRQAIEDIYEIREYYRPRSAKYAEQLTDKIFEKGDNLEKYPQIGRMVPFEEKLLDHDFEKAINQTITIVSNLIAANEEEIKDTLQKDFGDNRTLLNKYSLFFKKIHQSSETVKIRMEIAYF